MLRTRGEVKLTVFVPGDGVLEAALGRELRAELAKSPLFAEVVFRPGRDEAVAGDALVVDLGNCQSLWTGVYSRASVVANAAYSTTGDLAARDSKTVYLYGDKPTVIVDAKLTLEDESRGLMSLPGYSAELGCKLAREIARSLLVELDGCPRRTSARRRPASPPSLVRLLHRLAPSGRRQGLAGVAGGNT